MSSISGRIVQLSPAKRALLRQTLGKRLDLGIIPVPRRDESSDRAPLSFAQERLWFLEQLDPGNPFYNETFASEFLGRIDTGSLTAALQYIIDRHQTLRTSFEIADGRPVQRIHSHAAVVVREFDLRALAGPGQSAEVERRIREQSRQAFDLTHPPLLRACLMRLDEQRTTLVLTLHHIVCDAWSIGVLVRELSQAYEALEAGGTPDFPELPVQYADFALWQREWLQDAILEEQLDYWRQNLGDIDVVLDLPSDRPRPREQTYDGAREFFQIPTDIAERLASLAHGEQATLFMVLLSAFQTLLFRYSRQNRIRVGSPVANRRRPELEGLIGFFVNTLLLEADFSGDATFRSILQKSRENALAAYQHQDLPFERLVEALRPKRDLSHGPLFQILFAFENTPISTVRLSRLVLRPIKVDSGIATHDLTLFAWHEAGGSLGMAFEYSTALFDPGRIVRMVEHFRTLLQAIAARPDSSVCELDLMGNDERRQILLFSAGAPKVTSAAGTVTELFERKLGEYESLPAIEVVGTRLLYRELDNRANRLANWLIAAAVVRGDRVGVAMPSSVPMLVALLGVLKSGAVYVPLDTTLPEQRLAFMTADASPRIILTDSAGRDALPSGPWQIQVFDGEQDATAAFSTRPPAIAVGGDDLAYLLFTSGSTGQPKGVAMPHRSLANLIAWQLERSGVAPGARTLQSSALSFDVSLQEIFATWCSGGTLVLLNLPQGHDLSQVIHVLATNRIERIFLPFAALQGLAEAASLVTEPLALREIVCAGETLHIHACLRNWLARSEVRVLDNQYGPTESHVVSAFRLEAPADAWPVTPAIGQPLPGVQLFVAGARDQLSPIGIPGEVLIGGVALAHGYFNHPDWTAEKFVPDSITGSPGARLYHTGDLARWSESGTLEFLGRVDHQLKIRGYRVEPEEVECALKTHAGLKDAVVVVGEASGQKVLIAYLVPRDPFRPSRSELTEFLRRSLPEYMIPARFVVIDSLNLTANGKIDRRSIDTRHSTPLESEGPREKPAGEIERLLASIWKEVLGLSEVGTNQNFFELGGDSILSIRVVVKAGERGLSITPRDLFLHQTIAELSAAVRPAASRAAMARPSGPAPLTPIQHWFFAQRLAAPHHWNMSMLLQTRPVQPAAFLEAFQQVVAHHDAFRLRFHRENGGWRQIHADHALARCEHIVLQGNLEQRSKQLTGLAAALQSSFDLSHGPLVGCGLYNDGDHGPQRVLIAIHHLVSDAVSWPILLDDLERAYRRLTESGARGEPAKTASFQEWAQTLAGLSNSSDMLDELPYWTGQMRLEAAGLPVDFRSGENTEGASGIVFHTLGEEDMAALTAAAKVQRTSLNVPLIAALSKAIADWSGRSHTLIDVEGHGREFSPSGLDVSRTVGWFTALHPLLVDGGQPIESLWESTHDVLRKVPHNGIGYGILRYLSSVRDARVLDRFPASPVGFNYLGQFHDVLSQSSMFRPAGESAGPAGGPACLRAHLLDFEAAVFERRLHMQIRYSRNLHHEATIAALMERIAANLARLCERPLHKPYLASDFPRARLRQQDINKIVAAVAEQTAEETHHGSGH